MAKRDILQSHLTIGIAIFVALPFAVWGGLVVADVSASKLPIKASPIEEARELIYDVGSRLPWREGWAFYTTAGGDAEALGVGMYHPPGSSVSAFGENALAVSSEDEEDPIAFVGNVASLGFPAGEATLADVSDLEGLRLRELAVTRAEAGDGFPAWRAEEHRAFVVDVSEQERVIVEVSPAFGEVRRFLDGMTFSE